MKKKKCEGYKQNLDKKVVAGSLNEEEKALILANNNESLKVEALAILRKEKIRNEIISFLDKTTKDLGCSQDERNKINSLIVSHFAKQEKSHFEEWKEKLTEALAKPEPIMEEVATAIIFERNLATEWQYHYAEAIFKKQVIKDRIRSFIFEYSYEVQRASDAEHNKIADELTDMLKNFYQPEEEEF